MDKDFLQREIKELFDLYIPIHKINIITDTSDWMNIKRGDVLKLGDNHYLVRGNMREPRFGIDDQPKYWVFSAIDLTTRKEKIIKTVFHEEFYTHISVFKIRCYRDPEKEAKVLELTRGDDRFMQGFHIFDEKGNNVRIIDFVKGKSYFHYIPSINKPHKNYFEEDLPALLWKLLDSIKAIQFLHHNNLCHGDIRNDHIIIESDTMKFRWIDFDLKQDVSDFDIWSLGNILNYTVAKGIKTFNAIYKDPSIPDEVKRSLTPEDSSAFYGYRLMNLEKIYPYITPNLSNLLKHFTIKPIAFFKNIDDFVEKYYKMLITDFPNFSIE